VIGGGIGFPRKTIEGNQDKARRLVYEYVKRVHLQAMTEHATFAMDEVLIVWYCKTLRNWKALVITTLPDEMYYEVTYNGEREETYIDAYKKWQNVCIPDEPKVVPEVKHPANIPASYR
jgi:hypothetical protein